LHTSAPSRNKGLGNLIDVIQTNIGQDSWEVVGGAGVIKNFYEMLVVAQTPSIHREVETLLSGLRKAKKPIRGTLFHLR
jgi:enhancing lycopene biosynthesis protein 2